MLQSIICKNNLQTFIIHDIFIKYVYFLAFLHIYLMFAIIIYKVILLNCFIELSVLTSFQQHPSCAFGNCESKH